METTQWLPAWLRPLWEVPGVTDVLINGAQGVWFDRGVGLERADRAAQLPALTAADARALAVRLASAAGRRLDDASPTVDARLPDGSRLHAVLPPVASDGALVSVRMVRDGSLSMDDLVNARMVAPPLQPVLEGLVAARASILVSGATGAGKSTLMATLLSLVDPAERLVVIEEAGELRPEHPHVVRLIERQANVDGAGAVTMQRLVREALRMRPDRIVIGEVRGPEVREMLLALNTGHRGALASVHANSAADVPARLRALGSLAGLSEAAVAEHAGAAFDVVLHVDRAGGVRRVESLSVLTCRDGVLTAVPAARVQEGVVSRGPAWLELTGRAGLTGERSWAA